MRQPKQNQRNFIQLKIFALALLFSSISFANDFAAVLGVRTNTWDYTPSTNITASGKNGYQAGVLGFMEINPSLLFRSGFIYSTRVFTVKATGASTESEYNFNYFDIPLTVMYKFSDFGGVFGGAIIAMNAGKSCSGNNCSTDGVKSSLTGIQFGASFKFAPQMGAELYYETISGDIQSANGSAGNNAKSVVANLLITFE